MKTAIVALYPYNAQAQEAWMDHGAGMTYTASKHLDVELIDLKAFNNRFELARALQGFDLVAMGLKSSYYDIAMEVIWVAKAIGAKVMVAGIHTAAAPQELLSNPDIDYIFYGESEITFPKFLENPDDFGREIHGEKPQDLDALPFMDRSVFREPLEHACGWLGHQTMTTVIAARGCAYNCSFCQPVERNHFGRKIRRRSVDSLIAELRQLKYLHEPQFLMIHDDTFLQQPKWLEEFIDKYPEIGLPFWASGRADGICKHPDLVARLADVGWKLISVGFESGSQRILDMFKKGTTPEQNIEAARIIKSAGAHVYANYLLGAPTETKEEVQMTARMVDEIGADMDSFAYFSPYPGNELGEKCITDNLSLLKPGTYDRYPTGQKIKGIDYDYLDRVRAGLRE